MIGNPHKIKAKNLREKGYEQTQRRGQQNDVSLLALIQDLWEARLFLGFGAFFMFICATLFMAIAVPHYKARIVLGPANPMSGVDVSSLAGDERLGGLQFLAQRVGVQNSSDFTRFEHSFASADVAAILLDDQNIKHGLNIDTRWSSPFWSTHVDEPDFTPAKLAEYIDERVEFEPVGTSALKRFVYKHPSAEFAVYFLKRLHAAADTVIRDGVRQESESRIAYLNGLMVQTYNPEHRKVLTNLLMEQERLRMLVALDSDYAANVIEQARAVLKPVWPRKVLIYPTFVFVGLFLGFIIYQIQASYLYVHQKRHAVIKRDTMPSIHWINKENSNLNQPSLFDEDEEMSRKWYETGGAAE